MDITPEHVLDADEARRIIGFIRQCVEVALAEMKRAYDGRAWIALGYASWAELCAAEFPNRILPRGERTAAVTELHSGGMSTRAIAAATGVSQRTIVNDLAGEQNCSPDVVGLDGKSYPSSRPLPEIDPEADARRARREQVERDAERLRKFISGWFTFSTLATNPAREDILAALVEPDRVQLDGITRALRERNWSASSSRQDNGVSS